MPRDTVAAAAPDNSLRAYLCGRHLLPAVLCGRRPTLVGRLVTLLLAGALVVYVIANIGLWWTSAQLLEDSLEKQAVRWVAELDSLGTPHYLSRGGTPRLTVIEDRIRNFPEIAYVRYYDARGKRVIGAYGRAIPKGQAAVAEDELEKARARVGTETPYVINRAALSGRYLRVLAPVQVRSIPADGLFDFKLEGDRRENVKVIGFLEVGIDAAYYREAMVRSIVLGSIVVAVLFVLAAIIGRRFIRRALEPLTNLQAPLQRLAGGDIDVKVESSGDAEIAAIGEALDATIRALKLRDEALRKLAEHDPLTGLVNRATFSQVLALEMARLKESRTESALYFIDLDQFKYVNDTLGHAAGDRLLVQVAELLRSRLRENDVVSRFGGDEFTVLVRDVARAGAVEVAASVNQIIREAVVVGADHTFGVNCSIGITMLRGDGHSIEDLLSQADMACHGAKSRGRNRYQMFEPEDEDRLRMSTDIGWSQLIKLGIRENRFRLHYQPILSMNGSGREYYEVLLRLPRGGELVMPSVFLPVAQRFGMLAEIDHWVIRNALAALAAFRAPGRDVTFSINLSAQGFEDASLLPLIREQLERHKVPGSAVVFEITEQTAVRYLDRTQELIRGLIDIGCRFALDDFGSGFSSFSYLKNLPVEFVKIDGAFVENMSRDPIDQTMVRSIIQVAKALGKQTIAEFVQDEKTVNLLRGSGADYVQGNFVGMPLEKLVVVKDFPRTAVEPGGGTRPH
jgi:diguanylate cyclase (GGDEF)-like protein